MSGRGFTLVVADSDGTTFDLLVNQSYGNVSETVASVRPKRLPWFTSPIRTALSVSGADVTSVNAEQDTPVEITEAAGVRLALSILITRKMFAKSEDRARGIILGIETLAEAETYYWFAKVTHPQSGNRACRALRVLLTDVA